LSQLHSEILSGVVGKVMAFSSDLGDPLIQSAVFYFGMGDIHLDRQTLSVIAVLVAALIEELI
jgi:hypothetical protein